MDNDWATVWEEQPEREDNREREVPTVGEILVELLARYDARFATPSFPAPIQPRTNHAATV